jgi:hypothetical protein
MFAVNDLYSRSKSDAGQGLKSAVHKSSRSKGKQQVKEEEDTGSESDGANAVLRTLAAKFHKSSGSKGKQRYQTPQVKEEDAGSELDGANAALRTPAAKVHEVVEPAHNVAES